MLGTARMHDIIFCVRASIAASLFVYAVRDLRRTRVFISDDEPPWLIIPHRNADSDLVILILCIYWCTMEDHCVAPGIAVLPSLAEQRRTTMEDTPLGPVRTSCVAL